MKSAKFVIIALLIIAAIVVIIIRMRAEDRGKRIVAQETRKVIDVETGEVVEVTIGDWEMNFEKDPNTRLYKVDENGRVLSDIRICASCGKEIANPRVPPDGDYHKILSEYRCPECGNAAASMNELMP